MDEQTTISGATVEEINPLISVIVPTYNRPDRLKRALDSILGQDYDNFEIVVANDNIRDSDSDLQTQKLVASYMDEHIKLVNTTGKTGGGAARNLACRHASGEYLAFLDDDDVFLPNKLSTQIAFMLDNDLDMSFQDIEWHHEDGKLIERRIFDHVTAFDRTGLLKAHMVVPIAPTSIYMVKKSAYDRTQGFGEVLTGQDWYFMLRCIEAGMKIGYMPGVHVWQFLHQDERLSLGTNKIDGEVARHEVVQSYYPILSSDERKFVEFRYNAVLTVSCLRSKMFSRALGFAWKMVSVSPALCVKEAYSLLRKRRQSE